MRIKTVDTKNSVNQYRKVADSKSIAFTSGTRYVVKNSNALKNVIPTVAFVCSMVGATGYTLGASGLFYDLYKDRQNRKNHAKLLSAPPQGVPNYKYFYEPKSTAKNGEEGVKTIVGNTDFAKFGIKCAKTAVTATAIAGMSCGLGEGIPLMALGEATNLSSARIIETPVGIGLFGIGIASIFAGLALDNTPELKLNNFEVMAEESGKGKAKLIGKNMATVAKEISISIVEIGKNIFNPKWLKENILRLTPKTVVFSEMMNKDGEISVVRQLRHNKNYLMHAASFTLALGGLGIVISSALNAKKAQKVGLQVEEGGFLFDNFGMTKYGLDKFTTGGKSAGASFAIGGVINAISQFLGLDNKDGRALQWLGIAGVFLGYSIDRGKHLRQALKDAKFRPELTQVVRDWKIDLSKIVKDKNELNKLLKDIKLGKQITNERFVKIENSLKEIIGDDYKDSDVVKQEFSEIFGEEMSKRLHSNEIMRPSKAKRILTTCSEKIFGKEPEVYTGK